MAESSILFSTPMITALLQGKKIQTRRAAWQERIKKAGERMPSIWQKVRPGDRLWVRETHYVDSLGDRYGNGRHVLYYAKTPNDSPGWTSPLFMRRRDSRLTLIVTDLWRQPLQDISEEDAQKEGVMWPGQWNGSAAGQAARKIYGRKIQPAQAAFARLWDTLHGRPRRWEDNPEIVALTFDVARVNIDELSPSLLNR